MIIIAGAGHTKHDKNQLLSEKLCFHCNNTSKWILQRTRYFITLFFLPVAPYKTTFEIQCPICGNSVKLEKESYEQMLKTSTLYQ